MQPTRTKKPGKTLLQWKKIGSFSLHGGHSLCDLSTFSKYESASELIDVMRQKKEVAAFGLFIDSVKEQRSELGWFACG
jgi:hypothetical protein